MNQGNDNEEWLKKVKEKLSDYQEPVDPHDWESIEQKLTPAPSRHLLLRTVVWSAAAVVALLLGYTFFMHETYSPSAEKINSKSIHAEAPATVTSDTRRDTIQTVSTLQMPNDKLLAKADRQTTETTRRIENEESAQPIAVAVLSEPQVASKQNAPKNNNNVAPPNEQKVNASASVSNAPKSETGAKQTQKKNVPSKKRKQLLPVNDEALLAYNTPSRRQQWSVGISVGAAGKLSSTGGDGEVAYSNGIIYNLFAQSNHTPLTSGYRDLSFDHRQPVSIGLTVRKGVARRISVESGVVCTLLVSEQKNELTSKKDKQNVVYIGIPLKGNYTIVDKQPLEIYLTAGGTVEKCIYAHYKDMKLPTSAYQLSASGGIGAQYKLTKVIGIYFESGVAYYFDNRSEVKTIRTKSPFNLNLIAGIRLNY
jgi:cytoskeletal protein RodZ